MNAVLAKKEMKQETMLTQIEQVLRRGEEKEPPAYTFILGAGGSFGAVPTAKEMLGLPDKAGGTHERCIPFWIGRRCGEPGTDPVPSSNDGKKEFIREFWRKFLDLNHPRSSGDDRPVIDLGDDNLPAPSSIADAYKALFDQGRTGGLNSPQEARRFLRKITLPQDGQTQLNATQFYLASLLSLQRRPGALGLNKEELYVGRRPFARTLFTTNFDTLLQTSLQLFQLLYYMTDRPELLSADALQTDDHAAVHLFYAHGSVHRPFLANTDQEILHLKDRNARDLTAYLGTHGVIVLGYSGWDDCLLQALNQTSSFANNLYWLSRSEISLSEQVREFLRSHANAYWVSIKDGGKFMADLHARLCPGAPNTELLYNPVRPLLEQLRAVTLSDIPAGTSIASASGLDAGERSSDTPQDVPDDADQLRMKVLKILKDVEQRFTESPGIGRAVEELLRQADLKFSNNDWDAAWSAYDRILKDHPNLSVKQKGQAYLRRAACYRAKGDNDNSIDDYTKVIELPNAPDLKAKALVKRGNRYGRKGDHDKAIADYNKVIESGDAPPDIKAMALINRGKRYEQKGHHDKAIADYTKVIESGDAPPDVKARALVKRGNLYEREGDDKKAIADYTEVIGLPNAPADLKARALVSRGNLYEREGDDKKAIADYTEVIESDDATADQKARALVKRGDRYARKDDHYKAIADYIEVIELPNAPADHVATALFNRADIYRLKNDLENARGDYNRVLKFSGTPPEIAEKASQRIAELESEAAASYAEI